MDAKKSIRKRVLAARDALTLAEREQKSAAIAKALFATPLWPPRGVALFFYTMRTEVLTPPMIDEALAAGVAVALPRMAPGGRLILQAVRDLLRELAPNSMGIMEPTEACPEVDPGAVGIVLVPGVAFDGEGYRVGYGGGYYDRLLARSSVADRVALGFELQFVESVPRSPHDLPVDALVTEAGVRAFRANDRRKA